PLQPAAGDPARRRTHQRGAASRDLVARVPRPRRARDLPAESAADHHPPLRRIRAAAAMEVAAPPADADVLSRQAGATCDRRAALLRPRSRARARHARNTRAAALLAAALRGVGTPFVRLVEKRRAVALGGRATANGRPIPTRLQPRLLQEAPNLIVIRSLGSTLAENGLSRKPATHSFFTS